MNACLNATEARAYLRISERQWNKLVAAERWGLTGSPTKNLTGQSLTDWW